MFHTDIRRRAELINHTLETRKQMIVTVESCTGGLIAGALTDVSAAVHGGFVTYANGAKQEMGVPEDLLRAHGAAPNPWPEPWPRAPASGPAWRSP